ncbi:MAG: purine-nucleoside phosphorylase [Chitinophagaceae bacterium]|nr:purine-nucleoside phosphorylase [Chitinophagaceae bacterium]MCB9046565.1 purine-nucleoside phosphorylase [Chitinophagales bacterium]
MDYTQQVIEATQYLADKGIKDPEVGIVLGTGLGKMVDKITVITSISYSEIPHFPVATVESHSGKLIYGTIGNTTVLAMQGRFHYYEGYSMQQITFPVRVMHKLGIKKLLLSNAAGGVNLDFKKGDLVLIDDHINLQPGNPLRGLTGVEYEPRFPDMSCPYDKALSAIIISKAAEQGINLHKGVYACVMGPNLETRAEYRYLKIIGSDLVGMSTVPEVIVANQLSLPCAAVSVVTDECDPNNLHPVNIQEIIAVAGTADGRLSNLFASVIEAI